jgi:SAM-dependent methyltransferase
VLEAACGTGIVTRQLSQRLSAEARIVATDLHESMLAWARQTVGDDPRVEWVQADMTKLRFGDACFDAYVAGFGLMFVPDKRAAAHEARRVLRPDGRVFLTTWRPLEHNPVWRFAHEVVAAFFPKDPPQFYRRPTGFGEPGAMTELLRQSGFVDIRTEVVDKTSISPSARELAVGFIEGFPMADLIKARDPAMLPAEIDALTQALAAQYGAAPTRGPIAALVTSAAVPGA